MPKQADGLYGPEQLRQQALIATVTAGKPEPSSEWMAELELRLTGHLLDCILCSWLCTGPCW